MSSLGKGRENCPEQNGHRMFGMCGDFLLVGSVLDPNYCEVKDGICYRHNPCPTAPETA